MLVRAGHTEACCDLARLAGLTPAAVLCEIMRDDGTMARLPDLLQFAAEHELKIGTIADLIEYRSRNESLVQRIARARRSRPRGARFRLVVVPRPRARLRPSRAGARDAIARRRRRWCACTSRCRCIDLLDAGQGTHSWGVGEALDGDPRARAAASWCCSIARRAARRSKRGSQRAGGRRSRGAAASTCALYGIGAQILRDLGVGRMRLMAAPRKMPSMAGFGLEVTAT